MKSNFSSLHTVKLLKNQAQMRKKTLAVIHSSVWFRYDSKNSRRALRSGADLGPLCVCVCVHALNTLGLAGVTTCLHY